ncbi:dTDP-4-dehydrorhamnose reductase [Parashewanella curva]|uniref:dTDP-4-dehydrorhamnose reductase n=1 Tax=Parashewanella curva TaxID=2338552 RepID=A0A3L8Q1M1_9GAMM|nr:dTDP-4-dehydrorhamnose reductase [Parashewanella curva]RLV61531.1 dTDP-4-dehydrorhamnose reductase [Parashewanella curva]
MKVMILGANGQVGTHLVISCAQTTDLEVLALSSSELDIRSHTDVLNSVKSFQPDVIVNAAAYTQVDKAEVEPDLAHAVNAMAIEFIADAANAIDSVIIHISTDYVFDGKNDLSYKEQDLPNPLNVYGKTKWQGERLLLQKANKPILIRTSWVFSDSKNNFVSAMHSLSKTRKELSIVDDQVGAPTYAGHLADAIVSIANKSITNPKFSFGIYHFNGEPFVSWFEFAKTIFEQSERRGLIQKQPKLWPIASEQYPSLAKRPKKACLQTSQFFKSNNSLSRDWRKGLDLVLSAKEKSKHESD